MQNIYFTECNSSKEEFPHIHALFLVKNAPQYEVNSDDDIIQFVDNYLACKNDKSPDMKAWQANMDIQYVSDPNYSIYEGLQFGS